MVVWGSAREVGLKLISGGREVRADMLSQEQLYRRFFLGGGVGVASNVWSEIYNNRPVLWSYGRHHPLAVKVGGVYLFNLDHYSVTTSRHRNQMFRVFKELSYRLVGVRYVWVSFKLLKMAGVDAFSDNFWVSDVGEDENKALFIVSKKYGCDWYVLRHHYKAMRLCEVESASGIVNPRLKLIQLAPIGPFETAWNRGKYWFVHETEPSTILTRLLFESSPFVLQDAFGYHSCEHGIVYNGSVYVAGNVQHCIDKDGKFKSGCYPMLRLGKGKVYLVEQERSMKSWWLPYAVSLPEVG